MRISDWSSDVCSSDLAVAAALARRELCGDAWNAIEREPESGSRPMVSPPAGRKSGARRAGALGDRLDRSAASGSAGDDRPLEGRQAGVGPVGERGQAQSDRSQRYAPSLRPKPAPPPTS